jgi:hypothetical protein
MRDFDPTASEFITSGYLERSRPGGVLYDIGSIVGVGSALIGASASGDAADAQANSAAAATRAQREMFDKQVELQAPFRDAGLSANNRLMYLLGLNPGGSGSSAPTYESLRAELAPQFTSQSQARTYNNDRSPFRQAIADDSGGFINGGGSQVDESGLNAAIQQRLSSYQAPQQADPNDPAYGSLMRNFSMNDFQADPGYEFRMREGTKAVEGGAAARGGLLSGAAQKALQKYGQESASQEYGNAFNRFTGQQTNQFNRLAGIVNTGQGATNQVSNAAANFGNQQANNLIGAGNAQAAGSIGQANALVGGANQAFNSYQNNQLMNMIRNPSGTSAMRPPSAEAYYGY